MQAIGEHCTFYFGEVNHCWFPFRETLLLDRLEEKEFKFITDFTVGISHHSKKSASVKLELQKRKQQTFSTENDRHKILENFYLCIMSLTSVTSVVRRPTSLLLCVDGERRFGQQQQSRGILFQEIIFSFSLFSHRATTFRLLRIARRITCR